MVLNTEWAQVEVIDLINDGSGLAFGIIGGRSTGVVVKTILPGGVADRDGRLQSGDHILQIGEVNLRGLGSEQVASVLRQCGIHVRMVVARPVESSSAEYQSLGSHASIVPTKILADPVELDKHLLENGLSETLLNPPGIYETSPFIYSGLETDAHLHAISGLVDVVKNPIPIGDASIIRTSNGINNISLNKKLTVQSDQREPPETETFIVHLIKDDLGLGITIAGYVCEKEEISGIFVKSISQGSAADMTGKIKINDRIVEVNGESILGFTNYEAVDILRNAGQVVEIKFERYLRGPKFDQLQQAIRANELRPTSLPSPTSTSTLPQIPFSLVKMSHLGIEVEGESRTSFDFDSGILQENSTTLNNEENEWLRSNRKSIQFSISSHESIYERWQGKLDDRTEIVIAEMSKEPGSGLGISLEGTVDVEDGKEIHPHHFIRNILPDGPVGKNGVLQSGDELLEVNGIQLLDLNHLEVVSILKQLPDFVKFVCARYPVPTRVINTAQHREAFQARKILAGSLQTLIPTNDHRLVKAKSETSIGSSMASDCGNSENKSRSLEMLTGLPIWSNETLVVELNKGEHGLGFSILDYQDPLCPQESVIVIRSVVPGGVAQFDGRLIPGDRLMAVNGINLEHATLDRAAQVLKGSPKGIVRIAVAKPVSSNENGSYASQDTEDDQTCLDDFQECLEEYQECLDVVHISLEGDDSFNNSPCTSQVEDLGEKTPSIPQITTMIENNITVKQKYSKSDSACDSDVDVSFKSTTCKPSESSKSTVVTAKQKRRRLCKTDSLSDKVSSQSEKDDFETCIDEPLSEETNKSNHETDNLENYQIVQSNAEQVIATDVDVTPTNSKTDLRLDQQGFDFLPKRSNELSTENEPKLHKEFFNTDLQINVTTSSETLLPRGAKKTEESFLNQTEIFPFAFIDSSNSISGENTLSLEVDTLLSLRKTETTSEPCLSPQVRDKPQFLGNEEPKSYDDHRQYNPDEFFLVQYPPTPPKEVIKSMSHPNVVDFPFSKLKRKSYRRCVKEYYNDYEDCLELYKDNAIVNKREEMHDDDIFNNLIIPFKSRSTPDIMDRSFVTLTYDPGPEKYRRKSDFVSGNKNDFLIPMTVIKPLVNEYGAVKTHQFSEMLEKHWGSTHTVKVYREPNTSLGISIVGGKVDIKSSDNEHGGVMGIFVKNVVPNTPAGRTGMFRSGDRILEVGGISLQNTSHENAVQVIRNASNPVVFIVQSLKSLNDTESIVPKQSSLPIQTEVESPPNHVQENHQDSHQIYTQDSIKLEEPSTSQEILNDPPTTSREIVTPEPEEGSIKRKTTYTSDSEEEDDEDTREMEGRTVSARGMQIDRASAANVKRTKDEINTDPEKEDDFGYTTNKVKKKYANLGHSIVMVQIERSNQGLGLSLAGHKDRNCMAVFVCGLNPKGAAFKAGGIQVGDEILEVNGVVLHGRCHLNASAIIKGLSGPIFKIIILRRKTAIDDIAVKPITQFPVSLAEEASEEHFAANYPNVRTVSIKKGSQSLGIMIIEGKHAEVGQGIFISDIQEGSAAEKAGLEIGEMILAVNKDSLVGSNYDTAANLLKKTEGLVTLVVSNPGKKDSAIGNDVNKNSVGNALKVSGPPSRPATPVPEGPSDPATCAIHPGCDTTIEVTTENKGLGCHFVGGKDTQITSGIVLVEISKGGMAEKDGRLQAGDQILDVNGVSLKDVTNTTALQALRQTLPKMKIIVHRPDKIEYTIIEADLVKKPGKGFGLSVITRKTGKGVYVAEIINGGAAELDGRICRGDLLISVNGQIVEETPGEEVGALLKTLSGKVSLKFHRFKPVPSPR